MIVNDALFGPLALLLALAVAVTVVLVAAPWAGGPAPLAGRLRIARAVLVVDFWLECYGVRGRRRRALRAELRANLHEAARASGPRAAVAALGPLRGLARQYACATHEAPPGSDTSARRTRWQRGSVWVAVTMVAIVALSLLTTFTWADASLSGDGTVAAGRPLTSPWLYQEVHRLGDGGFSVETRVDWWVPLVPLVAFAVGALTWRRPRQEIMAG